MNTIFLRKSATLVILAVTLVNTTMFGQVYAACSPTPTGGADTILCSGTSVNYTSGTQFDTNTGNDTLTNIVGGIINMILLFNAGVDSLFNEGTISNYVDFGAGDDVYTYGNTA